MWKQMYKTEKKKIHQWDEVNQTVGGTDMTQTFASVQTLAQLHSPSSLQQDFRELTQFFKLLKPH